MIDEIILCAARMLFWFSLYLSIDRDIQKAESKRYIDNISNKGDKDMFDKKMMKKIKMNKVGEYLMMGEPVYMVMMDGSLVEIEGAGDMESIFFHSITGGSFAVFRKSEGIGSFTKSIRIGSWTFSVNHEEKGGDKDVLTSGEEC